jgi:transposase-like protein
MVARAVYTECRCFACVPSQRKHMHPTATPVTQALHDACHSSVKRQAIDMVVQGRSVTSVASELSLRPTTLISWLRSDGVTLAGRPRPNVKVSHQARDQAIEQVMAGRDATLVAQQLGVSMARVYQWVRAAGQVKPKARNRSNARRYSDEFKRAAVHQVVELARSVQTVSVEVDISHQTLRSWIKAAACSVGA